MHRLFSTFLLCLSIALAGCEKRVSPVPTALSEESIGTAQDGPIPTAISIDEMDHYWCKDSLVSLEGYLLAPNKRLGSGASDTLFFHTRQALRIGPRLRAVFKVGGCNDCLQPTDLVGPTGFLVRSHDGKAMGIRDKVRISGVLRNPLVAPALEVSKVELLRPTDYDYSREQFEAITRASMLDSLCRYCVLNRITGRLLRGRIEEKDGSGILRFQIGDEVVKLSFLIAAGPNAMDTPSEGSAATEVAVRDHEGQLIDWDKPITVYSWSGDYHSPDRRTQYVEYVSQE